MSGIFFEGENDYCESTRFIDDMLRVFEGDKKKVLSLLETNPNELVRTLWKHNSPLSKDNECLFQMGKPYSVSIDDMLNKKHTVSDSLINYFICPQCKNMKRIIEFSSVKYTSPGEPVIIECGERAGQQLTYEETDIGALYIVKETDPQIVVNAYKNPNIKDLAKCSSATCRIPLKVSGDKLLKKYANCIYLGSDGFTNNIFINWYLYYNLKELKMPHILENEISFICNNKGYNLNEYLDIGSINNLQNYPEFLATSGKPSPTSKPDDKSPILKEISKSIIMQLFACLKALNDYDFSYGNYNSEGIKFKKEVVSYIYDGVHVSSPIRLVLSNFSNSACTVNFKEKIEDVKSMRLYCRNIVAEEELKKKHYEPIIQISTKKDGEEMAIYKIKDSKKGFKSNILFNYMRHLGFPVYTSSFDSYVMMCLLMTDRAFYTSVIEDELLKKFWNNMWVNADDIEIINDRLKDIHENPRSLELKEIDDLLSYVSLRCDNLDNCWDFIKQNF